MTKKIIKYCLIVLVVVFVAFNSIYFKKLDEVRAASSTNKFNAVDYARRFYNNKLVPQLESAVELSGLMAILKSRPEKAFEEYSQALSIGNIKYFLVQGKGVITTIDEDVMAIALAGDTTGKEIRIATEFIYGNAVRDASGLMNLNEFSNTSDLNSISEEINKIIRKEVLPAFKGISRRGDNIKFSGAIELNQAHLNLDSIEVIPVQLSIQKP